MVASLAILGEERSLTLNVEARGLALAGPLVIGGTLKIGYDLLLCKAFRDVRPPEEEMRGSCKIRPTPRQTVRGTSEPT